MTMRVLGIETSCDDTGIALYEDGLGLLAHTLYSQSDLHSKYGGVVPELASRDHAQRILPLVEETLQKAGCSIDSVDGVAYTAGPGLIGSLLVGSCFGKALSFALGKPGIPVHHMEGHLLAPMLEPNPPQYPFIALLVSGGHTLLVEVLGIGRYTILGESLDDAAGEAFDKTAKLLDLGYPGGPKLARLAEKGDPRRFKFPRPLVDRPNLDFSFSGLKTHTANALAGTLGSDQDKADIAWAFQEAVVDTLFVKAKRALVQRKQTRLVVAGGVGANRYLRERLAELEGLDLGVSEIEKADLGVSDSGIQVFYPRMEFCTDNGAMIAYAGCMRLKAGITDSLEIMALPRWSMDELEGV